MKMKGKKKNGMKNMENENGWLNFLLLKSLKMCPKYYKIAPRIMKNINHP